MTCRFATICALVLLPACPLDPESVVENEEEVALEPLGGDPDVGPAVFEVTVQAEVDPPYDRREEGGPVELGVRLFHCGANIFVDDGELRVPEGSFEDEVGPVLLVDYSALGEQDLRLGGAGPYTLSLVYDASGQPAYSESGTWSDGDVDLGSFPRALDRSQPLFQIDPAAGMLMVLDPSADYDAQSQSLTTSYTFVTESGQQHAITETYTFGGRYLPVAFRELFGCD